jgi:hypothetical protein
MPQGFKLDERRKAPRDIAPPPEMNVDPSEGMTGTEKFLVGAGYSVDKGLRGLKGGAKALYDVLSGQDKVSDKSLSGLITGEKKKDQGEEDADLYQKHRPKGWQTTAGEITGDIGMQAPLALVPGGLPAQVLTQALGSAALTPGDMAERGKAAAWGAGGAAAGNVLTKALGRVAQPIGDKAADTVALEAMGVRPTFGQGMSQKGTMVGRGIGAMEEGALSVPFASAPLRHTREAAIDQWRGATRAAALPDSLAAAAGGVPDTVDGVRRMVGRAYDNLLDPIQMPHAGVTYQPNMHQLTQGLPIDGASRDMVEQTFQGIRMNHIANPTGVQPTAAAAQRIESEMKSEAARLMGSRDPGDNAVGRAFRRLADDYGQTWRGAIPTNTRNAIAELDRSYPNLMAVKTAAKTVGAAASDANPNQYTPKVLYRAARTADRSPGKNAFIEGTAPMQEMARLGTTLEARMPDSGTAGRAIVGSTILGGGALAGVAPQTLAGAAALAVYGLGPVQNYLMGRVAPAQQRAILEFLRSQANWGAAAGAGAAPKKTNIPGVQDAP